MFRSRNSYMKEQGIERPLVAKIEKHETLAMFNNEIVTPISDN